MRVALLGTGTMGRLRAAACRDVDGVRLVAVLGRDPDRTAALARDSRARAVTSLADLLADHTIDGVDMCHISQPGPGRVTPFATPGTREF